MRPREKRLTSISRSCLQLSDVEYRAVAGALRTVPGRVSHVPGCAAQRAHVVPQDGTRDLSGCVLHRMSDVDLHSRIVSPAERADLPIASVVCGRLLLHTSYTNTSIISGQSNLIKGRIAAAHGRFSRIRQAVSYTHLTLPTILRV